MPGVTPVFGIRYPQMSDPISDQTFADEAADIDRVLAATNLLVTQKLNSPAARAQVVSGVNPMTPAVEATIIFNTELSDSDNMWSVGAPDRFTINTPGLYFLNLSDFGYNPSPATWTSIRYSFYLNGVRWSSAKKHATTGSSPVPATLQALLPCAVGDFVQVRLLYTGTGSTNLFQGTFAAALWCRL